MTAYGQFNSIKNMKKLLFVLTFGLSTICFGQTSKQDASDSKKTDRMKQFFYDLDDKFNVAMVKKDSLFFVNHLADKFINCTPVGDVNFKSQEILTLLKLPLLLVERTASKFDIFTYSDKIATMSVIKKLTRKDSSIMYVRRTIIYEKLNKKWFIVSGQGTNVLPKYID